MDRRKLILSVGAGTIGSGIAIPLFMRSPIFSTKAQNRFEPNLTPGTPTARYTVERSYSTATVAPLEPNDCFRQVYPHIENAKSAFSGVQVALNLTKSPNMVLWQHYEYSDEIAAAQGFEPLVWQTKIINAHKFREINPEALAEVPVKDIADKAVTYEHVIANGRGYAVTVARTGKIINVVRADKFGDPPTDFVLSSLAVLSEEFDPDSSIQTNENVPAMPGWKWSYGPMDILKDVVTTPSCGNSTL